MPIYRLLEQDASFGPDEVRILVTAHEAALEKLKLVNRADPLAELVARRILDRARQGERNIERLRDYGVSGV